MMVAHCSIAQRFDVFSAVNCSIDTCSFIWESLYTPWRREEKESSADIGREQYKAKGRGKHVGNFQG